MGFFNELLTYAPSVDNFYTLYTHFNIYVHLKFVDNVDNCIFTRFYKAYFVDKLWKVCEYEIYAFHS